MKIASVLLLPYISLVQNVFAAPIREQENKAQQQQQKKHDPKLGVVSDIFKRTLEEYDIQAPVVSGEDQHDHHDLYRISRMPQLQCHGANCLLRGQANIAPQLLESIKKRVGVIDFSPAFYRRPDYDFPEQERGVTAAGVTEVGVLTDTRILTHTSPVHSDHVPETGQVVDGDRNVAFVMLNSNPDAYFQHGETSVPIVEGSLVSFDGRTPHNTVVNSGYVHILGPFEMGASWISGQSALNTVGCFDNGASCVQYPYACCSTVCDGGFCKGLLNGSPCEYNQQCASTKCENEVCEGSPTQAPTTTPTQAPTISPTQAPTISPTQAPTVCPDRNKFRVEVLTDSRPRDIRYLVGTRVSSRKWERRTNGWVRLSHANTVHTSHLCLKANKCHKFVIRDRKKNGLCCGKGDGNYKIVFAGDEVEHVPFNETYFENNPNRTWQRTRFGKCGR